MEANAVFQQNLMKSVHNTIDQSEDHHDNGRKRKMKQLSINDQIIGFHKNKFIPFRIFSSFIRCNSFCRHFRYRSFKQNLVRKFQNPQSANTVFSINNFFLLSRKSCLPFCVKRPRLFLHLRPLKIQYPYLKLS